MRIEVEGITYELVTQAEADLEMDFAFGLDERMRKELRFAQTYAREFAHGTDGHSRLMLIAKLAQFLGEAQVGWRKVLP